MNWSHLRSKKLHSNNGILNDWFDLKQVAIMVDLILLQYLIGQLCTFSPFSNDKQIEIVESMLPK